MSPLYTSESHAEWPSDLDLERNRFILWGLLMRNIQDLLTILWFVLDCPIMDQEAKVPKMNIGSRIKDWFLTPGFVP